MPPTPELDEQVAKILASQLLRDCLTDRERQILDLWLLEWRKGLAAPITR